MLAWRGRRVELYAFRERVIHRRTRACEWSRSARVPARSRPQRSAWPRRARGGAGRLADWTRQRDGTALGVALSDYGGASVAAGIAEVSVDEGTGDIAVQRFWMVVDAGLIVAPRNTEAQLEGNVIYGLSNALRERITIRDGVVEQSNFHDYPVMRMNEVPRDRGQGAPERRSAFRGRRTRSRDDRRRGRERRVPGNGRTGAGVCRSHANACSRHSTPSEPTKREFSCTTRPCTSVSR